MRFSSCTGRRSHYNLGLFHEPPTRGLCPTELHSIIFQNRAQLSWTVSQEDRTSSDARARAQLQRPRRGSLLLLLLLLFFLLPLQSSWMSYPLSLSTAAYSTAAYGRHSETFFLLVNRLNRARPINKKRKLIIIVNLNHWNHKEQGWKCDF